MVEIELSVKEKLKLAIISQDLPDSFVENLFLDYEITDETDMLEITSAIIKHRPKIAGKIAQKFLGVLDKNK